MNCIALLRSRMGLPQWRFAERLGIDQATVSRMERGQVEIDVRTRRAVKQLADEIGAGLPDEVFAIPPAGEAA